MTFEEFREEARHLVRPCLILTTTPNGAEPVAYWHTTGWGGEYTLTSEAMATLDCRHLPGDLPSLLGTVHLRWEYGGPDREDPVAQVTHNPEGVFGITTEQANQPLYAVPGEAWPPFVAVLQLATPAIKSWIAESGINSEFPFWPSQDPKAGHAIKAAYQEHRANYEPLFREGHEMPDEVYIRLGGWHDLWPEADWLDLMDNKLIAFVYRDAEPYVEVWQSPDGQLSVIERIT
jgi:hypothetical protein